MLNRRNQKTVTAAALAGVLAVLVGLMVLGDRERAHRTPVDVGAPDSDGHSALQSQLRDASEVGSRAPVTAAAGDSSNREADRQLQLRAEGLPVSEDDLPRRVRMRAIDLRGEPIPSMHLQVTGRLGTWSAITGADGWTEVRGRGDVDESLTVACASRSRLLSTTPSTVRWGEQSAVIILLLEGQLVLEVRDAATQKPIEDYSLRIANQARLRLPTSLSHKGPHAQGMTILPGLEVATSVFVFPDDQAYLPSREILVTSAEGAAEHHVVLLARADIARFRAQDATGRAVRGARLALLKEQQSVSTQESAILDAFVQDVTLDELYVGAAGPQLALCLSHGVTDEEGRCSLRHDRLNRPTVLRIDADGFAPTVLRTFALDATQEFVVRLDVGGILQIDVSGEERPDMRLGLCLRGIAGSDQWPRRPSKWKWMEVRHGRIEWDGLPAGMFDLFAVAGGVMSPELAGAGVWVGDVVLQAGVVTNARLDLEEFAAAQLRVQLQDNGAAIAEGRVTVTQVATSVAGQRRELDTKFCTATDVLGEFVTEGLARGAYVLKLGRDGTSIVLDDALRVPPGRQTVRHYELRTGGASLVFIYSSGAKPFEAGSRVYVDAVNGAFGSSAQLQDGGRAHLRSIPLGSHRVTISVGERTSGAREVVARDCSIVVTEGSSPVAANRVLVR